MPAQDAALTRAELLRRFPELRAPLQRRLARVVGAADAEDLAGETLLRALDAVGGFRGQAALATWLQRIGLNLAYDLLRQQQRRTGRDQRGAEADDHVDDTDLEAHADEVGLPLQRGQMSRCVRDLLERLPAAQRQLLFEADMLDRPVAQIAGRSGMTTGNAKIRLHRARREMKTVLEAHCDLARGSDGTLCCVPKAMR